MVGADRKGRFYIVITFTDKHIGKQSKVVYIWLTDINDSRHQRFKNKHTLVFSRKERGTASLQTRKQVKPVEATGI